MRKLNNTFLLFLTILLFFVSVVYPQAVDPTAGAYSLKKISLKNFRACHDIKDWVITGKRTSVVFATDWDWMTSDQDLVVFGLNNKGVASPAAQILPGYISTLSRLSAVWIEDTSASPAKRKPGHGLVFAGYQDSDRSKVTLAVRKFNAKGTMAGGWKIIEIVSAGTNETIADQWLYAEVGPESVAVAYSVLTSENSGTYFGYKSSKANFIETDFNGDLLPQTGGQYSLRSIKIPDNGNLKIFRTFRPAWNGKRWLVPISNSRLKIVKNSDSPNYWGLLGEDVFVQVIKDRTQAVLTPNKLFGYNNSNVTWLYAYDLQFLPNAATAAVPSGKNGDKLKLYYRKITPLPENQRVYESKSFYHGIATITGKGKKTGPTVIVDIPDWNRSLTYDPDALLTRDDDYISRPIPADDGMFLLAQIYTMARGRNAVPMFTWDYESELNLLKVDPATGDVTVLANRIPVFGGFFDPPFINWFKNKICILNALVYRGAQYHVDPYFSRF